MADSEIAGAGATAVAAFIRTPAVPFDELIARIWRQGALTEDSLSAAWEAVARFAGADDERKGALAVALGLLAEASGPAAALVRRAVHAGLDTYLADWARRPLDGPLLLALQYLLAHFPADRAAVVAAAPELDPDDRSRLDRALATLDPADPDIGRAFPHPAAWELDDGEVAFDRGWIAALTPEQVRHHWEQDTETVLGHLGAKAYWAVRENRAPVPPMVDSIPPRNPRPHDADIALFERHAAAFRCPGCAGALEFETGGARCADCGNRYAIGSGILDVTATVGDSQDRAGDFLFKLAEIPSMGYFYEAHARPNFLRLCGSNWAGQVTPSDEDAYITAHVAPVEGPVLDLAAGAGRWTAVLAKAVGADRVIALDLGLPMLATTRERLPEVPAVLASAALVPFADASLGAVLCWNALQAFPDDAPAAIAEVGRCLRPGGTFTFLTFRTSDDPVYRYFVSRHHFPQHAAGLHLFDRADIMCWLAEAGLTVLDETAPGTFVIVTAQRPV